MTEQKIALLQQKSTLIARLLSRISANDFNGVQAIAGDIREIDAKLSVLGASETVAHEHRFDRYDAKLDAHRCECGAMDAGKEARIANAAGWEKRLG